MAIEPAQRDDLRRTYLAIYDNFAIHHTDLAHNLKGINSRYARELCATLQQAGLIVLTEDGDNNEVWQCVETHDTHTREQAEELVDLWLGAPSPMNATPTSGSSRSSLKSEQAGPHECRCGCGEVITTRSVYRPGHDARHAGQVGRQVAAIMEGGHDEGDQVEINRLYSTLGSDKLRTKALRIADKANQKNLKAAKPEPQIVEGIAKVGKNEVPARRYPNGLVEVLQPGKDWKTASKAAAKTFQEG